MWSDIPEGGEGVLRAAEDVGQTGGLQAMIISVASGNMKDILSGHLARELKEYKDASI